MKDINNNIKKRTKKLNTYLNRIAIIDEVITDQRLLKDEWNINFVADFCQIFDVIKPPIITDNAIFDNNKFFLEIRKPSQQEIETLFREKLKKSISFLGRKQVKTPPLLIPPYNIELNNHVDGIFARAVRFKLQEMVQFEKILEVRNRWIDLKDKIINYTEENTDIYESQEELLLEIEDFAKTTIEGIYYLILVNSLTAQSLNYLLNTKNECLSRFKKSDAFLEKYKKRDYHKWLELLNKQKDYNIPANVIDSQALMIIEILNELANEEERKDIYFLLTDAKNMWKITDKFKKKPKEFKDMFPEDDDEKDNIAYIKHKSFPEFCYSDGLHIIRTSDHFEEWLLSYHEDFITREKNLTDRKNMLITKIKLFLNQLIEKDKVCKRIDNKCYCLAQNECSILCNSIDEFFTTEEEITNLENIKDKKKAFENLFTFVEGNISETNRRNEEVSSLIDDFSSFFLVEYNDDFLSKLEQLLSKYKNDYYNNVQSIVNIISTDQEAIINFKNKLNRMDGLVYEIAFKEDKEILDLINMNLPGKDISDEEKTKKISRWYKEAYSIITQDNDNVINNIFALVFLYCYEYYNDCSWLANNWLKNKRDLIENAGKLIEYKILYASSTSRTLFHIEDKNMANIKLSAIIEMLKNLFKKYPDCPRIPYSIGKKYCRMYFFKINTNENILLESIKFSKKSIYLLDNNKSNSENLYEELRIRLKNNILWAINYLNNPTNELIDEAEDLYKSLNNIKDVAQYVETCASYEYKMALRKISEDVTVAKNILMDSIKKLKFSINLAYEQHLSRYEIKEMVNQIDIWKTKFDDLIRNRENKINES